MWAKIAASDWYPALKWGFGVALAQRLFLMIWMAVAWLFMTSRLPGAEALEQVARHLPALTPPIEQLVFGVWRRWDSIHYLRLAEVGYHASDPGPTVFGVLTPLAFRAVDFILPGGLDLAALVCASAAFAIALTLLYRICEVYYGKSELAPRAVTIMALQPLAYLFSAPLSESIYLAMVLGTFYAGAKEHWGKAAFFGILATLARPQGVLLVGIVGLLLLESSRNQQDAMWSVQLRQVARSAWPLVTLPLGFIGFIAFRYSLGLPPIEEVYNQYSYVFLVDPFTGLVLNFRYILQHPLEVLTNPDLASLPICVALATALAFHPQHRRLPLVVYTWGYLLVFISKMNWRWGTDEVIYSQSLARYSLALFPLTALIADGLWALPKLWRALSISLLILGMMLFSALHTVNLSVP